MAKPSNPIFKAIEVSNQGKRYPALDLVSINPGISALISKLVTPAIRPTFDGKGQQVIPMPNGTEYKNISHNRARNINDSETVMQLLPDMELSAQILVASIQSPKDMMASELNFIPPEGVLNSQTTAALMVELRQHFEQVYKIKPELGKILRKMLFETGSHVLVVLPENSLDEVINRNTFITMESLGDDINKDGSFTSLGVLGPRVKEQAPGKAFRGVALESLSAYRYQKTDEVSNVQLQYANESQLVSLEHIAVTDNINVLKLPILNQKIREQRVMAAVGSNSLFHSVIKQTQPSASLEGYETSSNMKASVAGGASIPNFNDAQLNNLLYKGKPTGYVPIVTLKTDNQLKRKSVGVPLVMELPSESVIPVHMPGKPDSHIGFFVLLDVNGNPVSKDNNRDYYADMGQRLQSTSSAGSATSDLLNRLKQQTNGFACGSHDHIDYSSRVYAEMIEQDLLSRLRNGIYANGAALARNEEVYRIMLARSLAAQHTQLLFVPIELITYFAFKYNQDGTGKSLLEDMKMINSLRAMLMFANVMASVKNSIGRTGVNLKFDEDDPDPMKTMEILKDMVTRSRQKAFPLGASDPVDVVEYLQNAGIEFGYEGHPGIPDVKVDFTEKQSSYAKPDTDLEESLRKRSINAVGLAPEMIDANSGAEFATSVANNNIMFARRVMSIQDEFTPQLMDHLRKYINATPALVNSLRKIVEDNFEANQDRLTEDEKKQFEGPSAKSYGVGQLLLEFVNGLTVALPRPNTVTMKNQAEEFDTYVILLDKALDAWINSDFFTEDMAGEVTSHVTSIKAVLRAHFIRMWLAENNVLPELSQITSTDEDGHPQINFWEDMQDHIGKLTKSLSRFMVKLQTPKAEADATLQASGVQAGDDSDGGSDYSSSSDAGAGGFDENGTDPFGGNMDFNDGTGSTDTEPNADPNKPEDAKPEDGNDQQEGEDPNSQSLL